jgi:hypothetical protein
LKIRIRPWEFLKSEKYDFEEEEPQQVLINCIDKMNWSFKGPT